MVDPGRSVFLSYRRDVSWQLAEVVQGHLTVRGFDVFVDTKDLGNGLFDEVILAEIARRPHVVVVLQPGSLDRIGEQGDWLRREIEHALALGRNVVPVVAGTAVPRAEVLPSSIADLSRLTAVTVPPDYFREAMGRLEARLLGGVLDAPALDLGPQVAGNSVNLRWTAVDGARVYVVQSARNEGFSGADEAYRGVTCEASVRVPWFGAVWYRVRAEGAGGLIGRWSGVVNVSTGFGWRTF